MGIAVVTGASAGLGEEFALQLQHDPEVDEIWLVARRADRLEDLAKRLTGARGVPIAADLQDAAQVQALADRFADAGPDLRVLINNAGYAVSGAFAERTQDDALGMVDLNIRALVHLTHAALQHMTAGSRILHVASSLAFFPAPGFDVYAATKAFVLAFSTGLSAELSARKIRNTVFCPGPVRTEFWDVATHGEKGPPPVITMSSKRAARIALSDARGFRWISVPGLMMKLVVLLERISPRRVTAVFVKWFSPY